MNIKVQISGIIIILVLIIFCYGKRTLKLNTERVFKKIMFMSLGGSILDVLSIIAITNRDEIPDILVEVVSKGYLLSLVGICALGLNYICIDVFKGESFKKSLKVIYFSDVIFSLIIIFTPIVYHYDESSSIVYTSGGCVAVAYVVAAIYMISSVIFAIKCKDTMNSRRRYAFLVWMIVWIGAAMLQLLITGLLLVSFASVVGVLIIFLQYENPELNLDSSTGMFNKSAFFKYTKQLYDLEEKFYVVDICFDRKFKGSVEDSTGEMVMRQVANYFKKVPTNYIFKIDPKNVAMVFKNHDDARFTLEYFENKFDECLSKYDETIKYTKFIYMKDSSIVPDGHDVLNVIIYARNTNVGLLQNRFMEVNESHVKAMNSEKKVEELINYALENNGLCVYYQPIYGSKQKKFISAEALARIIDKEGNIIPPGVFIRIAERTGLILKLGKEMFRKVCVFISENDMEELGLEYIEVNLSVVQCSYDRLAEEYIEIMEQYGVNPKYINIEITETASTSAKKTLLKNMAILMDYGVKFSLDDFGTGSSNLNYIVDMPVHIVKFDRDMINAYFESKKARYIMSTAINMIHGLELAIVSEGIETDTQLAEMERLGIECIQGYYFSKPVPEEQFIRFCKEKNAG